MSQVRMSFFAVRGWSMSLSREAEIVLIARGCTESLSQEEAIIFTVRGALARQFDVEHMSRVSSLLSYVEE